VSGCAQPAASLRPHCSRAREERERGGLLRLRSPEFQAEEVDADLSPWQPRGRRANSQRRRRWQDITVRGAARRIGRDMRGTGAGAARDLDVPGRQLEESTSDGFSPAPEREPENRGQPPREEIPRRATRASSSSAAAGIRDPIAGARVRREPAVVQAVVELLPAPPGTRESSTPWPLWPMQQRTFARHEEDAIAIGASPTRILRRGWTRATRIHARASSAGAAPRMGRPPTLRGLPGPSSGSRLI